MRHALFYFFALVYNNLLVLALFFVFALRVRVPSCLGPVAH
jgi:hypothetical protein